MIKPSEEIMNPEPLPCSVRRCRVRRSVTFLDTSICTTASATEFTTEVTVLEYASSKPWSLCCTNCTVVSVFSMQVYRQIVYQYILLTGWHVLFGQDGVSAL